MVWAKGKHGMGVRGSELEFQMEWLGEVSEQRKLGKTQRRGR